MRSYGAEPYQTTVQAGEVRYWDVYQQEWRVARHARDISDACLASFLTEERAAVLEELLP